MQSPNEVRPIPLSDRTQHSFNYSDFLSGGFFE